MRSGPAQGDLVERPIGFWLKEVDRLIEAGFDATLAAQDVGRRHWQVLSVLSGAVTTREGLAEALRPFDGSPFDSSPSGVRLDDVVRSLADRGWLRAERGGRLELTEEGRSTHERLRDAVAALRSRSTEGVSREQYEVTVATLARMAGNLSAMVPA